MVDKKTVKNKVWQIVYSKMKEAGYIVSDDIINGGNKCFKDNIKK